MHDAALVRRFERLDHLTRDAHDIVDGQSTSGSRWLGVERDPIGKRVALHQFQYERSNRKP